MSDEPKTHPDEEPRNPLVSAKNFGGPRPGHWGIPGFEIPWPDDWNPGMVLTDEQQKKIHDARLIAPERQIEVFWSLGHATRNLAHSLREVPGLPESLGHLRRMSAEAFVTAHFLLHDRMELEEVFRDIFPLGEDVWAQQMAAIAVKHWGGGKWTPLESLSGHFGWGNPLRIDLKQHWSENEGMKLTLDPGLKFTPERTEKSVLDEAISGLERLIESATAAKEKIETWRDRLNLTSERRPTGVKIRFQTLPRALAWELMTFLQLVPEHITQFPPWEDDELAALFTALHLNPNAAKHRSRARAAEPKWSVDDVQDLRAAYNKARKSAPPSV